MGLLDSLFGKKQVNPPVASSTPQLLDWSNSEIHLMALSRFLTPRAAIDGIPAYWESALKEKPQLTVNRYMGAGLLAPASLASTVEYCNTGAELKSLLKERGLKLSGKKQELVDRLLEADEQGMAKLHASRNIVECTPEVRLRVSHYVEDKKQEYHDAISAALSAIRKREFATASRIIGQYESKQLKIEAPNPLAIPSPPRTEAADAKALTEIFTLHPKILKDLPEQEWEPLHVATALSYLQRGRVHLQPEWFPADFVGVSKFDTSTTVRMMNFHINHLRNSRRMRDIGITKGRIRCIPGVSCDACQKIADKLQSLDALPELPYEKCTCNMGCRCYLEADMPWK